MKARVLTVEARPCPKCGGSHFKYNSPEERCVYKGQDVVGKYMCTSCGWQSGLKGEVE